MITNNSALLLSFGLSFNFEVADVRIIKATIELFDGFLDFSGEQLVGAAYHFVICHHIIIESLLDNVR